jgi:hypothetical protein
MTVLWNCHTGSDGGGLSLPSYFKMIFRQGETIALMRRCKAKDFFAKLSLIWSNLQAESMF